MKLFASLGFFAALAGSSFAQGQPFIKVRVYHADPWAVKALLEGVAFNQPELSTILGFAGVPDKESSLIESIFGGKGRLVVNSTDNSILFIPDRG